MAFKFELKFPDGGDAGTIETNEANWQPGDTVIAHGNQWFRVTAVIPLAKVEELVDLPLSRILEVEPV